ncbi:MAG: 50S ribosomal protein L22 [Mycoplasma sp.]
MKTTVSQRGIHLSSQKANLVCDLVRYKSTVEALNILNNTPAKAARFIKKLLTSAIANATNNHAMNASNLYIYAITANQGKTIKRMIPRAKGSSSPIRKRFITLVLTLSDDKNEKQKDLAAIKARMTKRNQVKNKTPKTTKANTPKIKFAKKGDK